MIVKKVLLVLLFFSLSLVIASSLEKTCVTYFYGEGCPHCENIAPLIENLSNDPNVQLVKYEVYKNEQNRMLLSDYYDAFAPSERKVIPIIFVSDKYVVGDVAIEQNLRSLIYENPGAICDVDLDTSNPYNTLAIITIFVVLIFGIYAVYKKYKK
jgi:thiol-disulfide isomerase/thioredoxin